MSNSFRARKIAYKLYLKYIYILKVQNDIFGDVLWHFDTLTLWHHVVSLLMLFPKNIVFGNNLYAFWQNQHKLPYRCSGYLQLPRSFGVRKENPAANKSNERIRRTKAHRNACRQKRLRLQDIYQILQKGVKAQRFHTFFLSFTTLLPSSFIHRIIESTENFREKQRNLEKFRDIQRWAFKFWLSVGFSYVPLHRQTKTT